MYTKPFSLRYLRQTPSKPLLPSQGALKRLIWYWTPLLAWMAAIFAVSGLTPETIDRASGPVPALPLLTRWGIAHAVEFGVLAALAYRLFVSYGLPAAPLLWISVLSVTMGYAATDELHQSLVPGRVPSWLDLGYDFLGALIGLLSAEAVVRVRQTGR